MKTCWIVTSGFDHICGSKALQNVSQLLKDRPEGVILIAADGGANLLHRLRIVPDRIAGDMDSISAEALSFFRGKLDFDLHPARKDETDAELAMELAISMGAESIVVFNSMQQRFDQSFAILSLLERARNKGLTASIETGTQKVFLASNVTKLPDAVGQTVSLAPLSRKVTGVLTKGFEYPLSRETLYRDHCRGISNVVVDRDAEICYENGELLIILSHDREDR